MSTYCKDHLYEVQEQPKLYYLPVPSRVLQFNILMLRSHSLRMLLPKTGRTTLTLTLRRFSCSEIQNDQLIPITQSFQF
uniref:Uncharacterized protein n=1 Tax=Sciurus vulgaris TaxID=55149 RepID=A0A8D2CT70_SCIVU